MKTQYLEPFRGLTVQQIKDQLDTLEAVDLKKIAEETECLLVGFPHGTGDEELEEVMADLYDLFTETPELEQYLSGP